MDSKLRERLRSLPGVDAVLEALGEEPVAASGSILTRLAREGIESARERIREGDEAEVPNARIIASRVRTRLEELAVPRPRGVINATGVLIHTNLGRSPLSRAAVDHLAAVAGGYSDLEFELEAGRRGSRHDHIRDLLCLLTGAEDVLVVNNNAAAVLLALGALARDREVIISRGELVEIGGSFRIPEILEASGARLREVGTTNRTHRRDYENAIGPETGLLLRVHASNYRIEGFTASVPLEDLVALGRERGVPVLVDLGSGALLDVEAAGVAREPMVSEVLAEGPDLVTFSGDKLLGGPQAGLVVGRREAVGQLRKHPLARAVRIDKLLLAALQSTLAAYLETERARHEIPVLRMLFADPEGIRGRAEELARVLERTLPGPAPRVVVEPGEAAVGGGTLPGEGLATWLVGIDPRPQSTAARLERALRQGAPAVLGRVHEDRVWLDLRTVSAEEEGSLPGLIAKAWARIGNGTAAEQGA